MKKRNRSGVTKSDFEKTCEFNDQFTGILSKTMDIARSLLDRSALFMEEIVVTKEGMTKHLKGLNLFKALGPNELHHRVIKEVASELGPVFAHLFKQSIDS